MSLAENAGTGSAAPVALRPCGSCTLCCKVLDIPELAKPAGKWCGLAKPGQGCSKHDERPQTCRSFQCEWTTNPEMPEDWQPSRTKFCIVRVRPDRYDILVDPGAPLAWKSPLYYPAIKQIAAGYTEEGILTVVCIGRKRIVVLPDQDHDLGTLAEGRDIALVREMRPDGLYIGVQLRGPAEPAAEASPQ